MMGAMARMRCMRWNWRTMLVLLLPAISASPLQAQPAPAEQQPATQLSRSTHRSGLHSARVRESYLRPVPHNSQLHRAGNHTALRPAAGAATRLNRVQQLKRELNARETAQQEIVIDLPSDVLFDFDKSTLRPDAMPALARAAELIGAYPQALVCIHGHTDSKGSDSYNQALSLRRAHAVAAHLQRGQAARPMRVYGFGESRPVAANTAPDGADNPQGRQRNRRVEIIIGAAGERAIAAAGQEGASCR